MYRGGRFIARNPAPTALSLVAVIAVGGFAVYAQTLNVQMASELAAQRQLIIDTIDDAIDEIWVFMGSELARENLISRLLGRTEELLRRHPNDTELLEIKARLLKALGHLYEDTSDTASMLRVSRDSLEIYDRLALLRSGDVEFVRSHAEAYIRVANSLHRNRMASENFDLIWSHEHKAMHKLRDAMRSTRSHRRARRLVLSLDRISFLLPIDESRLRLVEEA